MLDKAVCVHCPVTASAGMEVYCNTFPIPGGHLHALTDNKSKFFRANIRFFGFYNKVKGSCIFPCTSALYYTCFLSTRVNEKLISSSFACISCVYQKNEKVYPIENRNRKSSLGTSDFAHL